MYGQMTFTPCLFTSQKKPQKLMNRLSNIFKFSTWWKIALKPCQRCTVSISNPFGAFPCSENSSPQPHPQAVMSWQGLFSMDILARSSTVPCWNCPPCRGQSYPWVLASSTLQESSVRAHSAHQISCHFLRGDKKGFFAPFLMTGLKWSSKIPTKVILDSAEGQRFIHSVSFCSTLLPSL